MKLPPNTVVRSFGSACNRCGQSMTLSDVSSYFTQWEEVVGLVALAGSLGEKVLTHQQVVFLCTPCVSVALESSSVLAIEIVDVEELLNGQ